MAVIFLHSLECHHSQGCVTLVELSYFVILRVSIVCSQSCKHRFLDFQSGNKHRTWV